MGMILAATAVCYAVATFFRLREKVAGGSMKNHSRISLLIGIGFNLILLYVSTHSARTTAEFGLGSLFIIGALSMALAAVFIELMLQENYFSIFALPISLTLLLMSSLAAGQISGTHFAKPWFIAHLITSITGECFFVIAAVSAITYLFVVRKLKSKNRLKALYLFPPLARLDIITFQAITSGTISFFIGLSIGFYGNIEYFAKFTPALKHYFSLAVFLYYCSIILLRRRARFAGPRLANAALIGFVLSLALILIPSNELHWLSEATK